MTGGAAVGVQGEEPGSERHLTFPLKAGGIVPWRIYIIMADLLGIRQERFTAEETDVLVRRQRSYIVWGLRYLSKLASVLDSPHVVIFFLVIGCARQPLLSQIYIIISLFAPLRLGQYLDHIENVGVKSFVLVTI